MDLVSFYRALQRRILERECINSTESNVWISRKEERHPIFYYHINLSQTVYSFMRPFFPPLFLSTASGEFIRTGTITSLQEWWTQRISFEHSITLMKSWNCNYVFNRSLEFVQMQLFNDGLAIVRFTQSFCNCRLFRCHGEKRCWIWVWNLNEFCGFHTEQYWR